MMLNIWKPEIFHCRRTKKDFFEGWYFKMVDYSEKNACAVIPRRHPWRLHSWGSIKVTCFYYVSGRQKAENELF
jgi:hypothetical protein